MNKGLKALEELRQNTIDDTHMFDYMFFDIIEKELKEYELMKQTKYIVADKKPTDDDLEKLKNQRMFVTDLPQCEIKPLFDEETQKKIKALEIIKEKMVNLDDLNDAICEDSYHQNNEHNAIDIYNQNRFEYKQLTQEEFDLLKEVLL